MELLKLAVLCALCVLPVTLLRRKTPEQALLLTAAVLAVVAARSLALAVPAVRAVGDLFARAGIEGSHVAVLLKALGASVVTRLCGDLCKDGGSQALASAVELAGSAAVLLIALPLVEAVAELLLGFFA